MRTFLRPAELRRAVDRARSRRATVGFVPTMGALHEGHLSLVRRARADHDRVVVSVFVNPLQFGPGEDFARYPRDVARDARLCRSAGCDWLFLPRARDLYPRGFATAVLPGPVAARWEGAARPGHFRGVATVVLKLVNLVEPDTLYLGQKDYQQAQVVAGMLRDLNHRTRLAVAPTVRERDGLALSSRNVYLDPGERTRAAGLNRALREARSAARAGLRDTRAILARARRVLREQARPDAIEYLAIVDRESMEPLGRIERPAVAIAAIRIGRTRLIDNMMIGAPGRRRNVA